MRIDLSLLSFPAVKPKPTCLFGKPMLPPNPQIISPADAYIHDRIRLPLPPRSHRSGLTPVLHWGAALATVVGVLVEVPVMLTVVAIVKRTRPWYEAGKT